MIQRRTLLSFLPLAFIASCTKAQSAQRDSANVPTLTMDEGSSLASLLGAQGTPKWLRLTGSVRLIAGNSNPRPAILHRAIVLDVGAKAPRFFDVWAVEGEAPMAAPSVSSARGAVVEGVNDLGMASAWLARPLTYPGMSKAIEYSRLAATQARVMIIDATQIWLVEGAEGAAGPVLSDTARAAFDAWRVG